MSRTPDAIAPPSPFSTHLADAVERVGPAVVLVNGRPRYPASGTVCAPDLVVAADHAVERDDDLAVETHNGRALDARLVGRDPATDLAVLRVPGLDVPAAAPAGPVRVGQLVLAVGRPTGQGPMASVGVVSAVGGPLRTGRGTVLEQFIRTDATPYPGFSGGPLVDGSGAVVGVLTTGLVRGVGLAVPVGTAWRIAEALARDGVVKRGYLGVGTQPVRIPATQRPEGVAEHGLLVVTVAPGSPAEQGGLLVGDILVALDGHALADVEDLQALLAGDRVGATLPLEVIRGGARTTLQVTVGQRAAGSR